ncbi:hypothetical protein [Amycolatopsis sp. NPDC004079]|uniref:hypothetical protein n=1 Tax=Amycolatopsis sp. NPDC004079 TaxID=3154549 RepID=UPI0033A32068
MAELVTRREWLRRWCTAAGLPQSLAEAAYAQADDDGHWSGYWDELVDADSGHRPAGLLRWVRRNEDKPHRCPECHRVVTWDREAYGPRTRLRCVRCGVQWRAGRRVYPWPLRALRRR